MWSALGVDVVLGFRDLAFGACSFVVLGEGEGLLLRWLVVLLFLFRGDGMGEVLLRVRMG